MKEDANFFRIRSIELSGDHTLLRGPALAISFPDSPVSVVWGQNSSGKSLIASSISAAFDPRPGLRIATLREAGLNNIILTLTTRQGTVTKHFDLSAFELVSSPHVEPFTQDSSNGTTPHSEIRVNSVEHADLLEALHVIVNGVSDPPDERVIELFGQLLRLPTQQERASWASHLNTLIGDGTHGGRLDQARVQLAATQEDLARLRQLHEELERQRDRRQSLNRQLAELVSTGAVLKVELEQIERKLGLAQRAARVQSWLSEVRNEIAGVERLRDEHARGQEELDALAAQFRGAPESFPDLLDRYETCAQLRHNYTCEWNRLEQTRSRASESIRELESRLADLVPPESDAARTRINELKEEIRADESDLIILLRDRIALLRSREGAAQRLQSEFAAFRSVDDVHLARIRVHVNSSESAGVEVEFASRSETESRLRALEDRVREFSGYESLSERVEDELDDLARTRQVISSSNDMLESLATRRRDLESSGHDVRWSLAVIAAALVVGVPISLIAGWDIGLFVALASSGLLWLAYRSSRQAGASKLKELELHEEKLRERLKSASETHRLLETHLGPLATFQNIEDALARVAEYRSINEEISLLNKSLNDPSANASNADSESIVEISPGLAAYSPAELKRKLSEYDELQVRHHEIDREWIRYESDGDLAVRIEALESRVSRAKSEAEVIEAATSEQLQRYSDLRNRISDQLLSLRSQTPLVEDIENISIAVSELDSQIAAIVSEAGRPLDSADPEDIRRDWMRFGELRASQRRLKNELSARLSLDELQSRQSILADELQDVCGRLSDIDPLYRTQGTETDYVEKYQNELQSTSAVLANNIEEVENARREWDRTGLEELNRQIAAAPSIESLEAMMESQQEAVLSIQRDVQTTQDLVSSLDRELTESMLSLKSDVVRSANRMLETYFGGGVSSLDFADGSWRIATPLGTPRRIESLSRGQSEMMRLTLRATMLDMLTPVDRSPIVWDDVFGSLDASSLEGMRRLIADLSRWRQVILFTRDPRIREWGACVEIGIAQHSNA